MELIKAWIATRIQELGYMDEILLNYIYALLEIENLDGQTIQSQLTAWMEEKIAKKFMKELWSLLLSEQEGGHTLPQQLPGSGASIQQDGDPGNIRSSGGPTASNNTIINAIEEKELDFRESVAPHRISPSCSSLDRSKRSRGSGPCMESVSPQRQSPIAVSRRGQYCKRTSALPPPSSPSYHSRSPERRRPRSPSPRRYMSRTRSPSPSRCRSWSRSPGRHRAPKRHKRSGNSTTNSANQLPSPLRRSVKGSKDKVLPELPEEMFANRRMKKPTEGDPKDRNKSAQGFSSPEDHFENCILSWRELYKCRVALIRRCEKGCELDIKKIREAYDALLLDFPFLSMHWLKYAQHEKALSKSEKVMEVFERAVAVVPECIDIWLSYCKFSIAAYKDPGITRRLFERALDSVGSKSGSSRVWDLFIEYESSKMAWYNVNAIYTRILRSPIENIDSYFTRLARWNYFCIRFQIQGPSRFT